MSNRVLIVGSQAQQSLESCYCRAFQKLGWEVAFWDPVLALERVVLAGKLGRLWSKFVHIEPWLRKANTYLLEMVENFAADLVLIIATSGVRAGTLAQLRVRHPQTRFYCIYPDSPHHLDSERIACLPLFDRLFVTSPAWVDVFRRLGGEQVTYLPFAADTELYGVPKLEPRSALAHDIVFVGTWRPEREQLLESLADQDLVIWGGAYWQKRTRAQSPLKQKWGGREVIGVEFRQFVTQSKIALNIMDRVTWPGPNMRTFELPACGAFQLCERTAAVLEIFREDETIACFGSPEEARDKINFYLTHDDLRHRMAQVAHHFVTTKGHTYLNRVQELATLMKQDGLRS